MLKRVWREGNLLTLPSYTHTHTHTHTEEYYSAMKKAILPSAPWMNLEIIILSEVSQTEKDKYYMISLLCGILKMKQMNPYIQTHRHKKQTGYQRGKGLGRGINQDYGINRYKLLHIKQISKKDLLFSTGNYIQHHNNLLWKNNLKRYYICVLAYICISEPIFSTPKTNIVL